MASHVNSVGMLMPISADAGKRMDGSKKKSALKRLSPPCPARRQASSHTAAPSPPSSSGRARGSQGYDGHHSGVVLRNRLV